MLIIINPKNSLQMIPGQFVNKAQNFSHKRNVLI